MTIPYRPILASLLCASLAACATTPAVKVVCLPLKSYSPQEQAALGAELAGLPAGSMLARAMIDYEALRDADRACLAAH